MINSVSNYAERDYEEYTYNNQNRMATSRLIDKLAGNGTTTAYMYDAFGRRTLVEDAGSATIKTLYAGFSFEVVKEGPIFRSGMFTDAANTGINFGTSST